MFRDHSEVSINSLKRDISNYLPTFELTTDQNIQTICQLFHENIYKLFDSNCRLLTKMLSKTSYLKQWITNRIKEQINYKHLLFRRHRRRKVTFNNYNTFKNLYAKTLTKAKRDYFKSKFEASRGSTRDTWNNIEHILNT